MGFIRLAGVLLLFAVGEATEYAPWFPTLFQFNGRASYLFEHVEHVRTPRGDLAFNSNNSSVQLALNMTPWPNWNGEVEIFLTRTSETSFTYESVYTTIRYAWLDDISGDLVALVSGLTLSFPHSHFLRDLNYPYHGNVNAEFHTAIGKEWSRGLDWLFHIWGLAGWGIANRGSPWVHGLVDLEFKPLASLEGGVFTELLYGLGGDDLTFIEPFNGYASINHRSIDIGAYLNYHLCYVGTLSIAGWYNLYAQNFIFHYWGAALSFSFPFSIMDFL